MQSFMQHASVHLLTRNVLNFYSAGHHTWMGLTGCVQFDILELWFKQSRPPTRPRASVHPPGELLQRRVKIKVRLTGFPFWFGFGSPTHHLITSQQDPRAAAGGNVHDKHNLSAQGACVSGTGFILHSRWGLLLLLPQGSYANRCLLSGSHSSEQHAQRLLTAECKFTATGLVSKAQAR